MDKQHEKRVPKTQRRFLGENTPRFTPSNSQKVPNLKVLRHDGIHKYWLKNSLPSTTYWLLKWIDDYKKQLTKGKTTLIQKDPKKETVSNNYRPITCLSIIWKILTAQIREEIYYSLISRDLFPDEQKGWHKRTRGTGELLYIDQHTLKETKTGRKKSSDGMN